MSLRQLPNILSGLRIALIFPFVYMLLHGDYVAALLIYMAGAFSDGLDGFLARRYGWQTPLGGILDPVADKSFMAAVIVTLAYVGLVPLWLAGIIVLRDLVIIGGALSYRLLVGPFEGSATGLSKLNTAVLMLFVLAVLTKAGFGIPGEAIVRALGLALLATTISSGTDYINTWSRLAARAGEEPLNGG